jgi:MFS family permease
VAQFVVVLDASIMNIALPSIGSELDVSPEDLSWIVNGYVLTFGGFLLLGGRLADLLGRRRVFVAGSASQRRGSGMDCGWGGRAGGNP